MNIYVLCDFIYKDNGIDLISSYFNNPILEDIYFKAKNVDKSNIDINCISKVIELYKDIDLVNYIKSKINNFNSNTGYNIDNKDIYVIIGLNTSTIYTTKYNNKDVTVICLETTNSINYLDMFLAHEYTHYVRTQYINHDIFEYNIGERFITEGIACVYSQYISNMKDYECCIVPIETYNYVLNNINLLDNLIKDNLSSNKDMYKYFYMYAKVDIPVRTGYVYGYIKVMEYLKSNNLNINDIITIDWKEIL